jgi:drug/metabolite transporter (DMT)-like permease
MNDSRHSMKLAVAFVALWAAEEAMTARVLGRYGLTQVVWLRFVMHLLLLWALWGRHDVASLWRTKRPWCQLARSSMLVGMPACWMLGTQRGLSPAVLMSVFWLAPLLILGLAQWFLRERVSREVWLAVGVACVGVFALTGPYVLSRPHLLVFPLGMALCFSLYVVMTRSLRSEPTRTNLFYAGLGVCLLLTPLIPLKWVTPTLPDLLVHLGVALLGLGALFMLERLTAAAPLSNSVPLVYLQIPFAMGIAWSLGQHDPTLHALIGLLVIGAVAFHVWQRETRRIARLVRDTARGARSKA